MSGTGVKLSSSFSILLSLITNALLCHQKAESFRLNTQKKQLKTPGIIIALPLLNPISSEFG
jgi:hypothetical protein